MLQTLAPYFGYLATLFLVVSLVVKTELKFRIYNAIGSFVFMIYGTMFQAWPVLLTNLILLCINIFYLNRLYRHKESFDLIVFSGEEALAHKFLDFYNEDIKLYFPDFSATNLSGNLNFVVLRDLVIANIFSARLTDGNAVVDLNYTVKKYRDYKIGQFIFEKEKAFLLLKGVKKITYTGVAHAGHRKFLEVTGFKKEGEGYSKSIT